MAISIFPSTAAEFVSNNFVVDMNDTTNNTVTLQNVKQAGTYNISIESGDSSFDIYLLDSDGALVAYTNSTTVAAPGLFQIVVILGVADSEVVSFSYAGTVNNTDGEGDQPGAGAYLESISPADLPGIDDTATVVGGNFGTLTTIQFVSGATELEAKNIVVTNGTSLVVTRPDNLIEDDAPYDLRAINTGVTPPTGSNAHILAGTVTAGSDPTWVTTSPLTAGTINQAYTETLEATDSDGAIVSYTITAGALPTGLSLNSSTGVISGTITGGAQTFTVTVEDDGGNTTPKEFSLPVQLATGGTVSTDGNSVIHTFETSDDFVALTDITDAAYLIVGGGGSGGNLSSGFGGGGGGGGGVRSSFQSDPSPESLVTITAGTVSVTIGAANGDTSFGAIQTSLAGGSGGNGGGGSANGQNGAAGGGAGAENSSGGTGSNGGNGASTGGGTSHTGGGGGGGPQGTDGQAATFGNGPGGTGTTSSITGTAIRHGDGGNGGNNSSNGDPGDGRNGSTSGLVVVRY